MGSGKRVTRPLPWLRTRSQLALNSKHCEELVGFASRLTPNSAYNAVHEKMYLETGDTKQAEEFAKACRFLAMIRRDHGKDAFEMVVSSKIKKCPRLTSTDMKGVKTMSTKTKESKKQRKGKVKKSKAQETPAKSPSLPLEHITYRASVNGAFSRVRCIQEFKNDAQNPVEAVYVFPLPDEASITACTMKIGKRKVEAELKEKEKARKEYDDAVAAGHHAALLEQERPNIFTMNVGGIEPRESIDVEVDYVQRIPWQAGGGRFTIPLVVAPQFIPAVPTGKQAGGFADDTDEVPDASRITPKVAREGVSYNADISIMFSPGFRCKLSCPSHSSIIPEQVVAKADKIELKTSNILTDRDFTLVYESLSKAPELAVHTGEFDGESFLLANIIPPGDVAAVGSDVVFVLDCSGSMSGPSIGGLKVIAKQIARNLKNQKVGHMVGIVPFDDRVWPVHPVSEINDATESFIDSLDARGGTMLGLGLQKAEQMLASSKRQRVILMVTDGDTEHGKNWYGNGIRLVAVGISSAINDTRIKELTRRNYGTAEFVYPGEDYSAVSNRLAGYLSGPVLRDVEVKTNGEVVGVCDVFKGRPATIAVRFAKKSDKVHITGKDSDNKKCSWEFSATGAKECDFIAQIWAREFIRENQDKKMQIDASLKYGVICNYTSFVAVSLKEVPGKKPERVEIPVNLPAGWDYEAVFGPSMAQMGLTAGVKGFAALGTPRMRRVSIDHLLVAELCEVCEPEIPEAPTPTPPTPQIPVTPMRFTLDAKDIVDRITGILVAIAQGKRNDAEKAFKQLRKELTAQKISKLSPEKKAIAYYLACRLAAYGLRLDGWIMAKFRKPESKTATSLAWYNLAQKEEGRAYKATIPSGDEASEYIAWKFGRGERPASTEWSIVP